MENKQVILFIPPVTWNNYPYRDQELPNFLAGKGYSCIYLNPVAYKGSEQVARFAHVNSRKSPKKLEIVQRSSRFKKSLFQLIYENWLNIKAIRRYCPQAVISTDHLMSLLSCIYCRIKGIKFIFDVTDDWESVDRSMAGKYYKYLAKPLLARYSYAITSTSSQQHSYFQGYKPDTSYLISNGISPQIQKGLSQLTAESRKSMEINFIASLRDWYDFDLLIGLFAHFQELKLNIYGQGPLYAELLNKTEACPNIQLHGNIENHKTPELLQRSLFGILPLKNNQLNQSTCPIKLFDYWGAGKVVIAPPLEDLKRLGDKGILFASDMHQYIDAVNLIQKKPDLAGKMGQEGKANTEKLYNYEYIAKQFIHIISKP